MPPHSMREPCWDVCLDVSNLRCEIQLQIRDVCWFCETGIWKPSIPHPNVWSGLVFQTSTARQNTKNKEGQCATAHCGFASAAWPSMKARPSKRQEIGGARTLQKARLFFESQLLISTSLTRIQDVLLTQHTRMREVISTKHKNLGEQLWELQRSTD